jgi:hypothetical protein
MEYSGEMSSVAMIYVPSFINIGSAVQKLIEGKTHHRQHGDRISLLSHFQIKESRLKTGMFIYVCVRLFYVCIFLRR